MKIENMTDPTMKDWYALAEKELRGRSVESLAVDTPEGIDIKPVYTAGDAPDMNELPGFDPFTRGVRATMYTLSLIHI